MNPRGHDPEFSLGLVVMMNLSLEMTPESSDGHQGLTRGSTTLSRRPLLGRCGSLRILSGSACGGGSSSSVVAMLDPGEDRMAGSLFGASASRAQDVLPQQDDGGVHGGVVGYEGDSPQGPCRPSARRVVEEAWERKRSILSECNAVATRDRAAMT